jgi:hypothetical protein
MSEVKESIEDCKGRAGEIRNLVSFLDVELETEWEIVWILYDSSLRREAHLWEEVQSEIGERR